MQGLSIWNLEKDLRALFGVVLAREELNRIGLAKLVLVSSRMRETPGRPHRLQASSHKRYKAREGGVL